MKLGQDALMVGLNDILRYPFHAKYFDIEARAIGEGIFNSGKCFFVDLTHMNRQASGRIQSPPTSVAFEVFRFLM